MIDLHNHLLPGLDDGATDLESALHLARLAVQDGISHVVCTPHIHPGRYDNSPAGIETARAGLAAALEQAGLTLRLAAAAEVRFGLEVMDSFSRGTLPFLGEWQGNRVLLLEFPPGEFPFAAERLTQWLLERKVVPMIAHPERNKALMRSPAKLKPLLQQGCLLQVTADSVAGRFGPAVQAFSHALLEQDLISVLASDAHDPRHRPPRLGEGLEHAARLVGEARAERLVKHIPWQIAQSHFA